MVMNKENISEKQAISLMVLFVFGTAAIIVTGLEAKNDLWIATIIAILAAVGMAYIYAQFNHVFPGRDLFDIFEYCFGKVVGKVFIALYIWFGIHLAALVLRDLSELFFITVGSETPISIVMIAVVILSIVALKQGIETLARFSEFFVIILVAFSFITLLMLTPDMHVNHIFPILANGIKPVLNGAFSSFSFPFAEVVIFTMIFSNLKWKKTTYKVYASGVVIPGVILLVIGLVDLMVIGTEIASGYYYPTFLTATKISFKSFLERLQIIIAFLYVIGGFVKLNICILAANRGISKIFNCSEYRFIVVPVGLLVFNLSYSLYDGAIDFYEWTREVWRFYAFPFQVIIPILIFIILKIKIRTGKKMTM